MCHFKRFQHTSSQKSVNFYKAGEKCSSPLSNDKGYSASTHEFIFNGKKLYIIAYGTVCGSCLHRPVVITKNQPCKTLNTL